MQSKSSVYLSSLVGDQSSKRLCIEAAKAESQTAVHTVGRQLQGLLPNVVLKGKGTENNFETLDYLKYLQADRKTYIYQKETILTIPVNVTTQ